MFETGERAGVEERYSVAGNTSDMSVEADKRNSADVIIAAGWSPSRLGMALLRLHSEWNGLAKPRRASNEAVAVICAAHKADDALKRSKGEQIPNTTPAARAQAEADRWYATELRLTANGLKSRAAVWAQLEAWIGQKGIASNQAAETLYWWLDPICPKCSGHGLRKVHNQPALSAKRCGCNGGKRGAPEGAGRMIEYLDYCVGVARGSLKKRLRPE
jgi:hypothetical protein